MDEPFFGENAYDYLKMVNHIHSKLLTDCNEWEEGFIQSMQAKLKCLHVPSKDEVNEFLSQKEKVSIISTWHRLGL